jgi:hypothetical protein
MDSSNIKICCLQLKSHKNKIQKIISILLSIIKIKIFFIIRQQTIIINNNNLIQILINTN